MANLTNMYDLNAEAQQDFAPIPSGEYLAQIVDSDLVPNKKGTGDLLELTYAICDGPMKGRKVWARLNLRNESEVAQDIGNRQFASVREATGVPSPRDTQELHNRPHIIRVEFIPTGTVQKNGYTTTRDGNEVKAWKKAEGVAAQPQTPTHQSTPAATTAAPPWATRAA